MSEHLTRSKSRVKPEARRVRPAKSQPECEPESPKPLESAPLYLGKFVKWTNGKWMMDGEKMFRCVVYPHILASEEYTKWISIYVGKYTCHVFEAMEIDYEAINGFQGVCIDHMDCQLRNKRQTECFICFKEECICATKLKHCTFKELVLKERRKIFECLLTSFTLETQRIMISEFWDVLFKLPSSDLSQDKLLRMWWDSKRHGMFFLKHIYNPGAPEECKIQF
jgi:hypothetical protein